MDSHSCVSYSFLYYSILGIMTTLAFVERSLVIFGLHPISINEGFILRASILHAC